MTKASEALLASLHGAMAEHMMTRLAAEDITPAEISVIRQFLKDNAITSDPANDENLKSIAADLPDDLDDGSIIPMYGR